jgi:hypothetical protein
MILFVPDACGVARLYFNDIGTRNMLQIYRYPRSRILVPNIAHCEVLSTMISAYNNRVIDQAYYQASRHAFEGDLKRNKITVLNTSPDIVSLARDLICKHKVQPGRMALGGADSIYLATQRNASKTGERPRLASDPGYFR